MWQLIVLNIYYYYYYYLFYLFIYLLFFNTNIVAQAINKITVKIS